MKKIKRKQIENLLKFASITDDNIGDLLDFVNSVYEEAYWQAVKYNSLALIITYVIMTVVLILLEIL